MRLPWEFKRFPSLSWIFHESLHRTPMGVSWKYHERLALMEVPSKSHVSVMEIPRKFHESLMDFGFHKVLRKFHGNPMEVS